MEPQRATDDGDREGRKETPRLWLVRGGRGDAERSDPPGPPSDGNGHPGESVPRARLRAIVREAETGAERIAELSEDLAAKTAEVVRCRADLKVAERLAELLRLRCEALETPSKVTDRIDRLRRGVDSMGARLPPAE